MWRSCYVRGVVIDRVAGAGLSRGSGVDLEVVAMLLWSLWCNRNKVVWENKWASVEEILAKGVAVLESWSKANQGLEAVQIVPGDGMVDVWRKPIGGRVKCNIDGASFADVRRIGVGAVVRDAEGMVRAAFCKHQPREHEASTVEAIGLREVLSWIKEVDFSNVDFEMDSQVVVRAMERGVGDESLFGDIIRDCLSLLVEVFNSSISFVKRSANQAAHKLARASVSMSECISWSDSIPLLLYDVIDIFSQQ